MLDPRDVRGLVELALIARGLRLRRGDGERADHARSRRSRRRPDGKPPHVRGRRQPGPPHAVAQLGGHPGRGGRRHQPGADRGRRHHPAAAAPGPARQGPGHHRPAVRGTAGGCSPPCRGSGPSTRPTACRSTSGAASSTSTSRPCRGLWADSPAGFEGRYFSFSDVYSEPKAWRPEGPRMWFGGEWMHPALIRRMVRYGSGFHPFGTPSADDLAQLAEGLAAAGRDISEIELVGGTRATFASPDAVADVGEAHGRHRRAGRGGLLAVLHEAVAVHRRHRRGRRRSADTWSNTAPASTPRARFAAQSLPAATITRRSSWASSRFSAVERPPTISPS